MMLITYEKQGLNNFFKIVAEIIPENEVKSFKSDLEKFPIVKNIKVYRMEQLTSEEIEALK